MYSIILYSLVFLHFSIHKSVGDHSSIDESFKATLSDLLSTEGKIRLDSSITEAVASDLYHGHVTQLEKMQTSSQKSDQTSNNFVEKRRLFLNDVTELEDYEKQILLDYHNHNRSRLASGDGSIIGNDSLVYPSASNMNSLFWDDALAAVASNYASQQAINCSSYAFKHNSNRGSDFINNYGNLASFGYNSNDDSIYLGENIGLTLSSNDIDDISTFTNLLMDMWNEYQLWSYGTCCSSGVGHFTQMAWAETRYVGCGINKCIDDVDGYRWYWLVCNYYPGGNWVGEYPYDSGDCTAESNTCDEDRSLPCGSDSLCGGCMDPDYILSGYYEESGDCDNGLGVDVSTADPTTSPTTNNPTKSPIAPTADPTAGPTARPTTDPTISPTNKPSDNPTQNPTKNPSDLPTGSPTLRPTTGPTMTPTGRPTTVPSKLPSIQPTNIPSDRPTSHPSIDPTNTPTNKPTTVPTDKPTTPFPTVPLSDSPTNVPTAQPSSNPTDRPTEAPVDASTNIPSSEPSDDTTYTPTNAPTKVTTEIPTEIPTDRPTDTPSGRPSVQPTVQPTHIPTNAPVITAEPTMIPTQRPSLNPTNIPTDRPTNAPTIEPTTAMPNINPTNAPIDSNTHVSTMVPSSEPTMKPSNTPSDGPSDGPTTMRPTAEPTATPSDGPSILLKKHKRDDSLTHQKIKIREVTSGIKVKLVEIRNSGGTTWLAGSTCNAGKDNWEFFSKRQNNVLFQTPMDVRITGDNGQVLTSYDVIDSWDYPRGYKYDFGQNFASDSAAFTTNVDTSSSSLSLKWKLIALGCILLALILLYTTVCFLRKRKHMRDGSEGDGRGNQNENGSDLTNAIELGASVYKSQLNLNKNKNKKTADAMSPQIRSPTKSKSRSMLAQIIRSPGRTIDRQGAFSPLATQDMHAAMNDMDVGVDVENGETNMDKNDAVFSPTNRHRGANTFGNNEDEQPLSPLM